QHEAIMNAEKTYILETIFPILRERSTLFVQQLRSTQIIPRLMRCWPVPARFEPALSPMVGGSTSLTPPWRPRCDSRLCSLKHRPHAQITFFVTRMSELLLMRSSVRTNSTLGMPEPRLTLATCTTP